MDEPKHTVGSKPDMVSFSPFYIGTTIGYIGSEHSSKIGHLLAAFALNESFGIDGTLLCLRVEELTPGVKVDNEQTPVHHLLVTTEATLGAFALPGGGAASATHGHPSLRRVVSAGPGYLGVWEEGWRAL